MFAKPYKIKSNNTLKNSEKKHLVQRIQQEFPLVPEEKVKELLPVKSNASCMKLTLHCEENVNVYVVEGLPMMMELREGLVPTVCALWKVPELIPTITMASQVMSKIANGAPLYAPGVLTGASGSLVPHFPAGTIIAARTGDNSAAAVVGRAVMSSGDLLYKGSGVCLEPIHWHRDQLCRDLKFNKVERPDLGPIAAADNEVITAAVQQLSIQPVAKDEWPSLGSKVATTAHQPCIIPDQSLEQTHQQTLELTPQQTQDGLEDTADADINDTLNDSIDEETYIPSDMDGLLRWCLLSFLKLEGKKVELPLKTNLLYKNHMIPLCPPDHSLDVKKSSYKKMGKFLEAMEKEGLIQVREIDRGVDALTWLDPAHPLVRAHRAPSRLERAPPAAAQPDEQVHYVPPTVREMYCVTAHVAPLFAPLKKGTALTPSEVRAAVTEYVRTHKLSSSLKKGHVTVDTLLAILSGKQEQASIPWEEVMSSVYSKMTPSTEMQFSDGTVKLTKARLEPIKMQTVTRSGNKKVTLVSNLESFGFQLPPLAAAWQRAAATSCGVTRAPGARADQLLLQGDQTYFVAKLLVEKYGIPKKYVEGADKALKKKK